MNEEKKGVTEKNRAAFIHEVMGTAFLGISQLNKEEAQKVLKKTCLACVHSGRGFISKNYGYNFDKPDLDSFIAADEKMEKKLRNDESTLTREGNTVTLNAPGHECICPLVKHKIIEPFPNLCLCGTEWLRLMLEEASGKPVKATLLDSPNMGGKACRAKYEIQED